MYYSHSFFIYPFRFTRGLITNNLNTFLNFFFYNSTPPFGRPGGGKVVAAGASGSGAGRLSRGAILVRVFRLQRALAGRVRDAFRGTRGQFFGTAVCVP